MFRFANYVFGSDNESNANNENIDVNQCVERDVDDDWILIDGPIGDHKYKKPTITQIIEIDENDGNESELQTIAANYETTTYRVPQTSHNISDAQQTQQSIDKSCHSGADTAVAHQAMEESWFVTPPPCFNSLSNPVIIETTPLENLLIEHPSISVFGPSLPPIDQRSPHYDQSLIPSPQSTPDMSSNGSTQVMSRRQMRALKRQQQQQQSLANRNTTQTNINVHIRTGVLDELKVLSAQQSREVCGQKSLMTKSNMDRQNKVLVQRNKPQTRRAKMTLRPNGIYNNRKNC
ncbi:unnamed protein product [Medioppia subpectinata]|uniref:Tumor protein p53-inducible nuclear protein 1 n=1 Tax=Medioppia subpectinata TaxID=1979941 RepID=A0A7R9KPY6_9ACAR|nr:unnamed protein product [Medioppia subpectinata]CAG2107531.1 unnamed protein product [Medioppia subpectinata]